MKNKKSIIRLGDGEFRILLNKKGIEYQEYNDSLRNEISQIIKQYSKDSKYLLALPSSMFTKSILWYLKNDNIYVDCFGFYRFYFRYFMKNNVIYGDAFCFSKGNENEYKKLWENCDRILFVHNNKKYAIEFESKYAIKVDFIEIPQKNSYSKIDSIIKEIKNKLKKMKPNTMYKILISAGPTAKPIIYRLSKENIIAYDMGHCWDSPLKNPERE